jgi:Tfp pilus assembly protein PilX
MNAPVILRAQRGATLIVGLIMLVLITLMVTAAFMISTGNLRAVGNMQFRNEAIAAANAATEEVLNSLLTGGSTVAPPGSPNMPVDINNDDVTDYFVTIAAPTCVRASVAAPGFSSSLSLGKVMSTQSFWNTIWDIQADVDDAVTGARVRVRQGVRVLLTQSQKNSVCP